MDEREKIAEQLKKDVYSHLISYNKKRNEYDKKVMVANIILSATSFVTVVVLFLSFIWTDYENIWKTVALFVCAGSIILVKL